MSASLGVPPTGVAAAPFAPLETPPRALAAPPSLEAVAEAALPSLEAAAEAASASEEEAATVSLGELAGVSDDLPFSDALGNSQSGLSEVFGLYARYLNMSSAAAASDLVLPWLIKASCTR